MRFWKTKTAQPEQIAEFTLAEIRGEAPVEDALKDAPQVWRNCAYRDGEDEDPHELDMPLSELVQWAWISRDEDWWEVSLADEWFAALDLDADEDAIVATLAAHRSVAEAYHEDREVYRFRSQGAFTRIDAAALAASALLAGHQAALRGAGLV